MPTVELHDVTLAEALEFLSEAALIHDPAKVGMEIEVDASVTKPLPRWSKISEAEDGTNLPRLQMKVTLSLTNVRFDDALNEVARPVGCRAAPTPNGYRIVPYRDEPVETRTYFLPSEIFGETADPALFGVDPAPVARMKASLRQFLEDSGTHFREGTSCSFDLDKLKLTVGQTHYELDLIASILESLIPSPIPGPEMPKCIEPVRPWAESLTLGNVSLLHLSVPEAVMAINGEIEEWEVNVGARHDRKLGLESASAPGVPAIPGLEPLPVEKPESEQWYAGKRLWYSARNVSLLAVATVIAKAAGGQLRFDESSLSIVAPSKTILVSKAYLFSPKTDEWLSEPKSEDQKSMAQLLTSEKSYDLSVPGTYSSTEYWLGVRDTSARHEEVARFVEREWQEYYASDRWTKERQRQERLRQIQWSNTP